MINLYWLLYSWGKKIIIPFDKKFGWTPDPWKTFVLEKRKLKAC
jgi:hypothetical protein